MHIWVDADACPTLVRRILIKASQRTKVPLTFVANQSVPVPRSEHIRSLQVAQGFDVADDEIVRRIGAEDLLVTGDIPLASEAMDKGAAAVSPRGERFDADTIRQRLNLRDFMDTMRSSGVPQGGGPPPLGQRELQEFARHLDTWLQRGLARRPK